jgi:hypothetical protein
MSDFLLIRKKVGQTDAVGTVSFETIFGGHIQSKSLSMIADPTYDQTFKRLFTGTTKVNNFSGVDRLRSLLNGIYFPEADDDINAFQIRDITPLDGEYTSFGVSSAAGVMRFDIACLCTCWAGVQKPANAASVDSFNVEMQRAYDIGFNERLYNYAGGLFNKYNRPVKVLAFLNHIRGGTSDDSTWIMPWKMDARTGAPIEKLEDFTDVQSIDLKNASTSLIQNSNIAVHSKILGRKGREWLKILSVKQWQPNAGRYSVSTDGVATPEIKDAILVLSQVDDAALLSMENAEISAQGMLNTARGEGIKRGREEGREEGEKKALLSILQRQLSKEKSDKDIIDTMWIDEKKLAELKKELAELKKELEEGGVQKHKRMRFDEGEEKKEKEDDE